MVAASSPPGLADSAPQLASDGRTNRPGETPPGTWPDSDPFPPNWPPAFLTDGQPAAWDRGFGPNVAGEDSRQPPASVFGDRVGHAAEP